MNCYLKVDPSTIAIHPYPIVFKLSPASKVQENLRLWFACFAHALSAEIAKKKIKKTAASPTNLKAWQKQPFKTRAEIWFRPDVHVRMLTLWQRDILYNKNAGLRLKTRYSCSLERRSSFKLSHNAYQPHICTHIRQDKP